MQTTIESLAQKFHAYGVRPEQISNWLEHPKTHLVQMPGPEGPLPLFAVGDPGILEKPSVAIVGTRNASPFGIQAAARFARDLAAAGVTVVSGLARGIDTAAHEGTLLAEGRTVAVLAHGLDRIYPPENRALAARIVERGGLLLSEYPPGVAPLKHHFPARNRVIALAVRGVCVIEAPIKSGALISAQYAADLGREVWIVPGRYDEEQHAGGHRWIKSGARVIFSAAEVLEELNLERAAERNDDPVLLKTLRSFFLAELSSLSALAKDSRRSVSEVAALVEAGISRKWILEREGGRYVWLGPPSPAR